MRLCDSVSVLMGTTGSGKAIVGPQMPHGMVKLAPDTLSLNNAGYDYNDDQILGFSHTHTEGIGGSGGRGHILLMPAVGAISVEELCFCSPFSHEHEIAEVGYYAVDLLRYGIRAEMSASKNCSIFRLTYPEATDARLMIDLSHTLCRYALGYDGHIEAHGNRELCGYVVYPIGYPNTPETRVYFTLRLSKSFERVIYWQDGQIQPDAVSAGGRKFGAAPVFSTAAGEVVFVRVGISYISVEQASRNLDAQIPDDDFERVVCECRDAWDRALSVIEIETPDDNLRRIFYSDLYRCLNLPVEYDEEGGHFFLGADGRPHTLESHGRHFYSDMWALWDTFRSTHPLHHLLEPERQDDVAWTLVETYRQAGRLPMSPAPCLGLIPCMTGHHASSVLTESWFKGRRNFDAEAAYEGMKRAAAVLPDDVASQRAVDGVPAAYDALGYLPADEANSERDFSVSVTLEFSYDDWCTAQLSRALGYEEDARYFKRRAQNYRNVFDPKTGFVRRRRADGSWVEPFNPNDSHKRGFCECSPWEYTTLVPHDIQGVINLMGGDQRMVEHIDGTFSHNRFNHINETAFHIPFIYTFARRPDRTMEICRRYMPTVHSLEPGGLYGEDDSGAMSAWFALIALGLFPSCPARPCYTLTSPAFNRWTLHLPGGKTFTVTANGNSPENIYIQSAALNGDVLRRCWLSHAEIMAGGELVLEMGNQPSDWGTDFDAAPPSETTETPRFSVLAVEGDHTLRAGQPSEIRVHLRNDGADGSLDCQVLENGMVRSREVCYLARDTDGWFVLSAVAYDQATTSLSVCGVPFAVAVTEPQPPIWHCGDTRTDRVMVRSQDECIAVSADVQNLGSIAGTTEIFCLLDGEIADQECVTLSPGETRTVVFRLFLQSCGNHMAAIQPRTGTVGQAAELDYCTPPDEARWICRRGTAAEFGAAGEHLYIRAAGSQHQYPSVRSNRMEYGMLWNRVPVEGDFDAMVRIAWEGYTTPYAMHGIVVKNTLDRPWDDVGGLLYAGAMSSRGFFNKVYTDQVDADSLGGMRDGPEAPYWIRVEKRGQHFDCFYRNGEDADWIRQGGYTYPDAAQAQYVGLFVNSCVPDLRLVKFTDFSVTPVR